METRRACPEDLPAVEALTQRAGRTLPRLWRWEEHLASRAFVVTEHEGDVVGALFAWPDESPVAWVRLAALDDGLDVDEWLETALPPVLAALRRRGFTGLAWMDCGGWAGSGLQARGFQRLTDVVTLVKEDRILPDKAATDAHLRPASQADVPAIVAVDRAAFEPFWWRGQGSTRYRVAASPCFLVAEIADQVVGYTQGEINLPTAHLNRIAVVPARQGRGIGALLLRGALRTLWGNGAQRVTLNTQSENRPSKRLYRRFGFVPTGDRQRVWKLDL